MLTQWSSCWFAFPWLMLLTVLQLAVQFFWSSLFQRCYNGCLQKCKCFCPVHLPAAVFHSCHQSSAGQFCHRLSGSFWCIQLRGWRQVKGFDCGTDHGCTHLRQHSTLTKRTSSHMLYALKRKGMYILELVKDL